MIGSRVLLVALAGAGLTLQGCASKPPPAPPAPVVQAPPPPNYSGTYAGKVAWAKGCRMASQATLTVQGSTYNLPLSHALSFSGPVADDGSLSGNVAPVAAARHRKGGTPGGDLTGKIAGDEFTGQVHSGKCTGELDLKKTG